MALSTQLTPTAKQMLVGIAAGKGVACAAQDAGVADDDVANYVAELGAALNAGAPATLGAAYATDILTSQQRRAWLSRPQGIEFLTRLRLLSPEQRRVMDLMVAYPQATLPWLV